MKLKARAQILTIGQLEFARAYQDDDALIFMNGLSLLFRRKFFVPESGPEKMPAAETEIYVPVTEGCLPAFAEHIGEFVDVELNFPGIGAEKYEGGENISAQTTRAHQVDPEESAEMQITKIKVWLHSEGLEDEEGPPAGIVIRTLEAYKQANAALLPNQKESK